MGERNGPAAPVITATAADRNRRVMRPARIALAWLAVIAVDLLANAGLLAPLFDQSREPSLLPDDVLARRSPVAFALLGIAVIALAWLLDASGALVGCGL